jgi:hypothetical protein
MKIGDLVRHKTALEWGVGGVVVGGARTGPGPVLQKAG